MNKFKQAVSVRVDKYEYMLFELPEFRRGVLRILRGEDGVPVSGYCQCMNCGSEDGYEVASAQRYTVACECGATYDGKLIESEVLA